MKKSFLIRLCGASFAAFLSVAVLVLTGAMEATDAGIGARIRALETDTLSQVMRFISNAGQWYVYVPAAILLIILPVSRTKAGVPAAIVLAISAVTNHLLKIAFGVPRPDVRRLILESGYGFPSGHAMNGTAFLGFCTLVFLRSTYKRRQKIAVCTACVCFLLLTGFGRVYLGVHNTSDVLGGYAAGIFLCVITLLIRESHS